MRDAHQSGRFDAKPKQRQRMLAHFMEVATLGVITEAHGLTAPDHWRRTPGETALFWRRDVWHAVETGLQEIPTPPWRRGTDPRKALFIPWACLENRFSGVRVLRAGGHHPAHLYDPSQAAANDAVLDQLGKLFHELELTYLPDVTTYSADFNIDLSQRRNRSLVLEAPGLERYGLLTPPKATHGSRTIDAMLTNGRVLPAEMLPRVKGFDHRGFHTVVRRMLA